jgi:iron complex transport system ATP-binding protein
VRTGPAPDLLTDAELSALYGVRVSTVTYSDDGNPGSPRRTIVVHYNT